MLYHIILYCRGDPAPASPRHGRAAHRPAGLRRQQLLAGRDWPPLLRAAHAAAGRAGGLLQANI